ncbi:transporter substrate-binding domain-containing protein [Lichenibacterium dinghuense]|uniref:transporter substrate-binding domain-containing protein n=1 Tax=Lichenibacterium dinghuense TaxID=2895977 RepID=UPI001F1F9CA6|nr:transporter substrate-binding domain-containing protein [Lichenibacterium sp. 6Y81]
MAGHRWIGMAAALALLAAGAASAEEAAAPQAAPQTLLDRVVATHQLRVGLTGDYRPFSLQDSATGAFTGLDVDLTTGLAKALGAEPVFVKTSWPTLMADFQAGKFDVLAGGVSVTLDRQRDGFFSVPTDVDGKAAIARCADAERYDGLDAIDRPGVRVVVNPGGTNERFDRAHLHNAQILTFPDNKTIFREVAEGRADVMITDGVEKLNPGLCAIHPDRPFDRAEKAWLLPRDIAFKLFVDQYIHLKQLDGSYAAAVKAWLD